MSDTTTLKSRVRAAAADDPGIPGGNILHSPAARKMAARMSAVHCLVIGLVIALAAVKENRFDAITAGWLIALGVWAPIATWLPWDQWSHNWIAKVYFIGAASFVFFAYHFENPYLLLGLYPEAVVFADVYWYRRSLLILHESLMIGAFVVSALLIGGAAVTALILIAAPMMAASALVVGALSHRFIRSQMQQTRFQMTVTSLLEALQARDGYTGKHSKKTLEMAAAVADELGLDDRQTRELTDIALLHDIGKIGIPNSILQKPGKLTAEEWVKMRQHPVIGEQILREIPGFEAIATAVRHEHERWDGDGYPDGIAGERIPLTSRIVFACDAFHAMTSDRPYRKAMPVEEAREELRKNAGGQFDPAIVEAFERVIERGAIGVAGDLDGGEDAQMANEPAAPEISKQALIVDLDGAVRKDPVAPVALASEPGTVMAIADPRTMSAAIGLAWGLPAVFMSAYLAFGPGFDGPGAGFVALMFAVAVIGISLRSRRARLALNLVAGMSAYPLIPLVALHYDEPAIFTLLLLPALWTATLLWQHPVIRVLHSCVVVAVFAALPLVLFGSDALVFAAVGARAFPGLLLVVGFYTRRLFEMRFEHGRFSGTTSSLLLALQARDGYTGEHSDKTLRMAMMAADELNLSDAARLELKDVALLHDIGKIGVPDEILHKPGGLSDEESEIMRRHPVIGEQIVGRMPGFESVATAIRHEHERWDGDGYPDGIAGERIPLTSRIVFACDAFHAMTSDRPYRKAMSVRAARAELVDCSGSQFDPLVVTALLAALNRQAADATALPRPVLVKAA